MTPILKHPPLRDPVYLRAQRDMPSAVSGLYATADESVVACHVRAGGGGGMGMKPGDDRTVPLLTSEHRKQHVMGEARFWRMYVPEKVLMAAVVRWREEAYREWLAEREAA